MCRVVWLLQVEGPGPGDHEEAGHQGQHHPHHRQGRHHHQGRATEVQGQGSFNEF